MLKRYILKGHFHARMHISSETPPGSSLSNICPVALTKSCNFVFRQNEMHISEQLLDSTTNNHAEPYFIEHKNTGVASLTCVIK